jgi:hypothetical protein
MSFQSFRGIWSKELGGLTVARNRYSCNFNVLCMYMFCYVAEEKDCSLAAAAV